VPSGVAEQGANPAAGSAPEPPGEIGETVPHGLSGAGVVAEVAVALSTLAPQVPVAMAEGLDEVTTIAELQGCQFSQKKLTLEVATHTAGAMEQTLLRVQDDATLDLARREKAAVRLRLTVANRAHRASTMYRCLPTTAHSTFDNPQWAASACLRLGTPFQSARGLATCTCSRTAALDEGFHLLVCPKAGVAAAAHNILQRVMQSTINNFTFCTARLEQFVDHATSLRRLDLVVAHVGADAHTVAVDVSSVNPLADSYAVGKPPGGLSAGAGDPRLQTLAAARLSEKRKHDKYDADCKKKGVVFDPFVLELTGGWGASTKTFLKWLREEVERKTPGTAGAVLGRFTKDVACLHRKAVVGRLMESCNRMRKGLQVDWLDTCVDLFDEDLPLLPCVVA